MDKTGFDRLSGLLGFLILLSPVSAPSHDSLYNYVEIRCDREGSARIEFSVNYEDLFETPVPQDSSPGSDAEPTREQLRIAPARLSGFLVRTFPTFPLDRAALVFPDDAAARPGFLLASAPLVRSERFALDYDPGAGKRLMLVVTRPGAFPEVHDLAPGEKIELSLP